MASVPKCSLCKITEKLEKTFENKKKNFLVYSMFIILSVEVFSFFMNIFHTPNKNGYDLYSDFVYIALTQLVLFLLVSSIFLWRERLHFCLRKATATMFLSSYYLFNFLAVIFCFSANFYFQIISFCLLILTLLMLIQSFYSKKYGK